MLASLPAQPNPPEAPRWRAWLHGTVLNAGTLTKELDARGRGDRPESDADVLRQLLEDAGPANAASRLLGDWAFAAEHGGARWLAREAMGLVELAWGIDAEGTVHAGAPAEVAEALGRPAMDPEAVGTWLATGTLPPPLTGWSGVHQLPPGHLLRVDASGRATVSPFSEPPPSTPGFGSRGDLRRWGKSLEGAFQVAVLHRLDHGHATAVLTGTGDLDAELEAMADAKRRQPVARIGPVAESATAADLEALCRQGPGVPPIAVARLLALRRAALSGHTVVLAADGGRVLTGAEPRGARATLAELARPSAGRLLARRGVLDPGALWRGGSADPRVAWRAAHGPARWPDVVDGSGAARGHALDRLWWLRSGVLPGLSRASLVAGVRVLAPWATVAIEGLCASVPAWLRSPPGRPDALLRASFPRIPGEPPGPRDPAAPLPMPVDAALEALGDQVDGGAIRAVWAPDGDPRLRWRLATLAAWRRSGTVG